MPVIAKSEEGVFLPERERERERERCGSTSSTWTLYAEISEAGAKLGIVEKRR